MTKGRKGRAQKRVKPNDSAHPARAVDAARQTGRKPTCTSDVTQKITLAIASGASFTAACARAGVGRSTANEWRQKGRQGIEPYAAFERAMELAEGAWQADAEERIFRADDWKAQSWLLERRREEYRPPSKVELAGKDGGPIVFAGKRIEEMSAAEIEAAKLEEARKTLAAHRTQRGEIETESQAEPSERD